MAKKYIEADEFWNRLISVSENDWVGFDTIDEVLSEMPSEQRWIPCSECKRRCEKWENLETSQVNDLEA